MSLLIKTYNLIHNIHTYQIIHSTDEVFQEIKNFVPRVTVD